MEIRIIDLTKDQLVDESISKELKNAIHKRFARNELSIVFLNRKGYSPVIYCRNCGKVTKCPKCSIPLVYHSDTSEIKCHYCNYTEKYSGVCSCKSNRLTFFGLGTEKIVSILNNFFPEANILKLDRDTVRNYQIKQKVISEILSNKYDIIVGTQFILQFKEIFVNEKKFRKLTFVGFVDIDTGLYLPHYRSAEHTFELVYNLSEFIYPDGELLIQTHNPKHYIFRYIKTLDWKKFYNRELKYRKELFYPPYSNLVSVIIEGTKKENVINEISSYSKFITELNENLFLIGPIQHKQKKIRKKYYEQFMLKIPVERTYEITRKLANYIPVYKTFISYSFE